MNNFKTIEEKAIEWRVSKRYVQFLCRQGKIDGVIKRAGVWFIPAIASNPAKNKKSNGRYLKFNGTKRKIFEKAVKLFAEKSYDSVSIKDITDEVGIRQSALYNHFKSKQEILDAIYDLFCHHFTAGRPSLEDLEPIIRTGSLLDIMNSVTYEFDEDYKEVMIDICIIIFLRKSMDERAREISELFFVKEGIEFVEAVFNKAVEIGRIAPTDTQSISVFCNSIRIFLLYNWIISPSVENLENWLGIEQKLFKYATILLTDLKAPVNQ